MPYFQYLLEANLYLCILYAFYRLFLHKETFYQLNRCFLLSSIVLAFVWPFVQIKSNTDHTAALVQENGFIQHTNEWKITETEDPFVSSSLIKDTQAPAINEAIDWLFYTQTLYFFVCAIFAWRIVQALWRIA